MAYAASDQDRWKGAAAALVATAVLGWALIAGLVVRSGLAREDGLVTFSVLPDVPPRPHPRSIPPSQRDRQPLGEAAPPNVTSQPTEIVAPPLPTLATPVIAAPVAGDDAQASAGAAALPGPGTGAGGIGNGFGAGGEGDGYGSGRDDETPPRWLRGRIRNSDLPDWAAEGGVGGRVGVRYVVRTDGRVSDCETTRSSGSRALDAHTCRLIEQRFRYAPSRDATGRAVTSAIVEDHEWVLEDVAD